MKKVNKPVYVTDDGEEFESEVEALAHETRLNVEPKVREFVESLQMTERGRQGLLNRILEWEEHKAGVKVAAPVPVVEEEEEVAHG